MGSGEVGGVGLGGMKVGDGKASGITSCIDQIRCWTARLHRMQSYTGALMRAIVLVLASADTRHDVAT